MIYNADGQMCVDGSTLSALAACTTRALVLHGWERTPGERQSWAMEAGTAMHRVMETFYFRAPGDVGAARATFEQVYQVEPPERLKYLAKDNMRRVLQSWLDRNTPYEEMFPFEVVATEQAFDVPFWGEVRFAGRFDLVARDGLGQVWIVDHKVSSRCGDPAWWDNWELASQLLGYVWAAQRLYAPATVAGAIINGMHIVQVPASSRRCNTHGTGYAACGMRHLEHQRKAFRCSPHLLDAWHKQALALCVRWRTVTTQWPTPGAPGATPGAPGAAPGATDMGEVPMEGLWRYNECVRCPLSEWCKAGRPTWMVPTWMDNTWSPFTCEKEEGA